MHAEILAAARYCDIFTKSSGFKTYHTNDFDAFILNGIIKMVFPKQETGVVFV